MPDGEPVPFPIADFDRINALNDDPGAGVLWTRVNVGEATPGAVTPLTADFQRPANTWPAGRIFHRMGLIPSPDIPGVKDERSATTRFFCAQMAVSLDFLRWLADRTPGTSGDAFEASILGSVRPGVKSQPDRSRYAIAGMKLAGLIATLPGAVAAIHERTAAWWRGAVAAAEQASLAEAASLFDTARDRYERVIDTAGLLAILSPAALDQISRPLKKMGAESDLLTVAAGYGSVKETDMLEKIWAIAHGRMRMSLFLDEFGYMCPAGGELESLSWREDSGALDPLLDTFRHATRDESPRRRLERTMTAAAAKRAELLDKARGGGRLALRFGFWLANRLLPLREVGKACMFMGCDAGRAAARRVGVLLTDAGRIANPEDVFFLSYDEIMRAPVTTEGFAGVAAERRALREAYAAVELPDFFTSEELRAILEREAKRAAAPVKAQDRASAAPAIVAEAFTLQGAAASAGRVTARARIVRDPRQAKGFAKGDILVCHVTDPGWTAIMSMAGGMIVDIGGMLSHSAIIARELGVPAVVNTRDGTKRIPDGSLITLDGAAGTVLVHATAEAH